MRQTQPIKYNAAKELNLQTKPEKKRAKCVHKSIFIAYEKFEVISRNNKKETKNNKALL